MKAKLVVVIAMVVTELCYSFIQFARNLMKFRQEVMKFGYLERSDRVVLLFSGKIF